MGNEPTVVIPDKILLCLHITLCGEQRWKRDFIFHHHIEYKVPQGVMDYITLGRDIQVFQGL